MGLTAYGYYTGAVDGIMGPQTKTAISKFQAAWGLPVTGSVTPEVLNALGIVAQ
jgi:peptidoglycan hydrolase-like protein with peptidoglycan-binding domain